MSIDLEKEQLITFGQAARLLPKSSRPTYVTWWRWWRHGVRGVKLETVLIGGKRLTSRPAMQRFADALSARHADSFPAGCSPLRRERDRRTADVQLRRHGIL